MKNGKSILEIAQKLQSIRDTGRDFAVGANALGKMQAEVTDHGQPDIKPELAITIQNGEKHIFTPSAFAHGQVSEYADIPREYYRRVLGENPNLLANAINHGMAMQIAIRAGQPRGKSGGRLLRTHGGTLRALVSSSYRTLDNFDLFDAVAPVMHDLSMDPISQELTDSRLYIKALSTKIQGEVKKGDVVQYGLVVSNSDVGAGSVRVEPMIYRLVCLNGMITRSAIRQAHLGRNVAGDDISELLTDATKELNDKAFWNTVRDVVRNYAKPEFFEAELNKLRIAADEPVKLFDLPELVERSLKSIKLTVNDKVRESIIDNLASGAHGAGLNKWGLSNAFTYAAGSVEELDYDTATELERAGSKIIELDRKSWEVINAK